MSVNADGVVLDISEDNMEKYNYKEAIVHDIKEYIISSSNNKIFNNNIMGDICHRHNVFNKQDNYVQNFWFKKKLKEKVEQFLQVMTEYQKYQSNIGILKWDSKNNELPRW